MVFIVTEGISKPSRDCALVTVTSALQCDSEVSQIWSRLLHRQKKSRLVPKVWFINGVVYKSKGFLRHFWAREQMIHGDSRNPISKAENIFGRIRWLLCGPFREFKKRPKN